MSTCSDTLNDAVFKSSEEPRRRLMRSKFQPRSTGALVTTLLLVSGLFIISTSTTYASHLGQSPSRAALVDPVPSNPVSGRAVSIETLTTADVLARVNLVRATLDQIRIEMGQPKDQRVEIVASNVTPREAVFKAFTLLRKANHLRFEVTGTITPEKQIAIPHDIHPLHTWRIVNAAYGPLLTVKHTLGIHEQIKEQQQTAGVTPSTLFRAMAAANRQFDTLFMQGVSSNNTVQQVALASGHTMRLLEQFPQRVPVSTMPEFERGKQPGEVHALLVRAYEKVRAIATASGVPTMKLEVVPSKRSHIITASDVFDVAIILVSQLAYLHGQLQDTDPTGISFDPGYKVASHVYQQASLLLAQLTTLELYVNENPEWLVR